MIMFANILICLICVQIVTAKKFAVYTSLDCPEPYVNIISDYKCYLLKNAKGFLMMNTGFKFKQDLYNITLNFKVKIRRGPKLLETYLNMNIDICDAMTVAHNHFLLKMIALEIQHTSNLPIECPLKKVKMLTQMFR
ncbi:uncharacterized protein LOC135955437 [Calliphora vicina]|uniref:uncharacterized protein LOC135955437 n=1 Tax=Calliphora vicina TaxID=7373 RepID=UPI00325AC8CC